MGEAVADERVERTLGTHFDREILKDVILRSHDAHRPVQIGESGFQTVPRPHEQRLGIDQLHLHEIHIQFRLELLAIERLDLARDDAAFTDRFLCNLHQSPVFQTDEIGRPHVEYHERVPRVDVLLLCPFDQVSGVHGVSAMNPKSKIRWLTDTPPTY